LRWLAIEMRDHVTAQDSSFGGRHVAERRHHVEDAILHRDIDAEAAEFRVFLPVARA